MDYNKKVFLNLLIVSIIIAVLFSIIYKSNLTAQDTEEDNTELITELRELSEIPEEDRTIDDWKSIIQLILKISMKYADNIDIIYSQWSSELQKYKELNNRNEELNTQLKETITNYNQAIKELHNTESILQEIIFNYQKQLKEIERNNFSNYIGLSPILDFKGNFSIRLEYLHFFDYKLSIGANILLYSVNNGNDFSLGIGCSVGYVF